MKNGNSMTNILACNEVSFSLVLPVLHYTDKAEANEQIVNKT